MYLSTETCWLYPASSTAVTCTAEPLPGSPGSISPATVSSSPQAPFSSPATGEIYSSVISRNSPRVHSTSSLSPATSPGYRTEDDWTMVKDLGERRKIQNRVAQRRYRGRMKERVNELEAELERRMIHTGGHGGNGVAQGLSGVPILSIPSALPNNGHSSVNGLTGLDLILTQPPFDHFQPHPLLIPGGESTSSLFSHNPPFPNSSLNSHSSPQADNVVRRPPGWPDFEQATTVPQALKEDDHPDRISTLHRGTGFPAQSDYAPPEEPPQCTVTQGIQANSLKTLGNLTTACYYRMSNDGDTTPLATEMDLSTADHWIHWDRQPSCEETFKLMESILSSEASTCNTLLSQIKHTIETEDFANHSSKGESLNFIKRTLLVELPNLWALNMALARDTSFEGRSNTALVTALIQISAGQIRKDQLLAWVDACI